MSREAYSDDEHYRIDFMVVKTYLHFLGPVANLCFRGFLLHSTGQLTHVCLQIISSHGCEY